jgi:hypothetical protein
MKNLITLILLIIISSSAKSQLNYSQLDYLYIDNLGSKSISQQDLKLIISCKKNKIKNGIKQGRFEQLVVRGEIKFLDEFKYIPDIEKSLLAEADISLIEKIKEGGDFLIFVGNYVDGIKQGEFKLIKVKNDRERQKTSLGLVASINYLNDSINGNLTFINKDLVFGDFYEEKNYTTVLMSQNKISDQKIQIPKSSNFIVFKNNNLDSGYFFNKYYYKKLNSPGEYDLTFFHDFKNPENGKTVLRVSNGNKFLEKENNVWDDDNLKCVGVCVTKDRYTTFSINESNFTGFIKCYYFNDSLNYSINTSNGHIDIRTDLAIDKKIEILRFPDYPVIKFELFNLLNGGSEFLSDKDNLFIEQYNTGYFKIAEIKNMSFSNLDYYGRSKNILTWSNKNPFSIDYKIGEHIFRSESWQKDIIGNLEMQFTNFDLKGNVLNSSDMVKNKEAIKRIEEEKEYKRLFGIKDDDAVVSCAFCKKTYVKKNGEAIKVAVCNSTSILCLNANGIPCEWTFCSMKCSNDFQCSQCAQSKAYRANCN